jgi:hypothetical protein
MESIQRNLDQANAANEQRYGDILGLYDSGKSQMMSAIESTFGQILNNGLNPAPALAREAKRSKQTESRAMGDLTSRGLGNSSLRADVRRGVADDSAIRQEEIYNSVNTQQNTARQSMLQAILGTLQQFTSGKAGVMERRTDEGPDLNAIAQILMQPGALGGTGGGASPIAALQAGRRGGGQPLTFGGGWVRPNAGGGGGGPVLPTSSPQTVRQRPLHPQTLRRDRTVGGTNFTYMA